VSVSHEDAVRGVIDESADAVEQKQGVAIEWEARDQLAKSALAQKKFHTELDANESAALEKLRVAAKSVFEAAAAVAASEQQQFAFAGGGESPPPTVSVEVLFQIRWPYPIGPA